jgi:hypothetical protein
MMSEIFILNLFEFGTIRRILNLFELGLLSVM